MPEKIIEMLNKITEGKGTLEDLDTIEELCYHLKSSALCGLGQTAPNPVLSTLRFFRDEYIAEKIQNAVTAALDITSKRVYICGRNTQ